MWNSERGIFESFVITLVPKLRLGNERKPEFGNKRKGDKKQKNLAVPANPCDIV